MLTATCNELVVLIKLEGGIRLQKLGNIIYSSKEIKLARLVCDILFYSEQEICSKNEIAKTKTLKK